MRQGEGISLTITTLSVSFEQYRCVQGTHQSLIWVGTQCCCWLLRFSDQSSDTGNIQSRWSTSVHHPRDVHCRPYWYGEHKWTNFVSGDFWYKAKIGLEPIDRSTGDNPSNTCVPNLRRLPDNPTNASLAVAYLDIPDLVSLSRASPRFAVLTSDPILHRDRLRLTAPSRVAHSLFGASSNGILLRPSVGQLLQRGIMRGLGIERQWRAGGYFYSSRVRNRLSGPF